MCSISVVRSVVYKSLPNSKDDSKKHHILAYNINYLQLI
jgi:hypothetical protein